MRSSLAGRQHGPNQRVCRPSRSSWSSVCGLDKSSPFSFLGAFICSKKRSLSPFHLVPAQTLFPRSIRLMLPWMSLPPLPHRSLRSLQRQQVVVKGVAAPLAAGAGPSQGNLQRFTGMRGLPVRCPGRRYARELTQKLSHSQSLLAMATPLGLRAGVKNALSILLSSLPDVEVVPPFTRCGTFGWESPSCRTDVINVSKRRCCTDMLSWWMELAHVLSRLVSFHFVSSLYPNQTFYVEAHNLELSLGETKDIRVWAFPSDVKLYEVG